MTLKTLNEKLFMLESQTPESTTPKSELREILDDPEVKKVFEGRWEKIDPLTIVHDDIFEEYFEMFNVLMYSYKYTSRKVNMSSRRYKVMLKYFVDSVKNLAEDPIHFLNPDSIDGKDPWEYYNSDEFFELFKEIYENMDHTDSYGRPLFEVIQYAVMGFTLETSEKIVSLFKESKMKIAHNNQYIEMVNMHNKSLMGFYLFKYTTLDNAKKSLISETSIDNLLLSELSEDMARKILLDNTTPSFLLTYRMVQKLFEPLRNKSEHYGTLLSALVRIAIVKPFTIFQLSIRKVLTLEDIKGFNGGTYEGMNFTLLNLLLKHYYIDDLDELLEILMVHTEGMNSAEKEELLRNINTKTLMNHVDPAIRLILMN